MSNISPLANLPMAASLSHTLAHRIEASASLDSALDAIVESAGLLGAALYLPSSDTAFKLAAFSGFGASDRAQLIGRFERADFLTLAPGEPHTLSRYSPPAGELLEQARAEAAVLVPINLRPEGLGWLLLGSNDPAIHQGDWIALFQLIAVQLDHAMLVKSLVTRLASADLRYRTLFENANDAIYLSDLQGVLVETNRRGEELLGLPRSQVVGRPYTDFLESADVGRDARRLQLLAKGELEIDNFVVRRPGGGHVIVDQSVRLVQLGTEQTVLSIARDVTDRKRAERSLRESEARYRSLFDGMPLPCWVTEEKGARFVAVNDAALGVYGYSREEFLAMDASELLTRDSSRHRTKDGTLIDVEVTVRGISFEGKHAALVVVKNITERRRSELELQLLQTITLSVSEAADLPAAITLFLRKICDATSAVVANVWTPRSNGTLACAASVSQEERGRRLVEGFTFRLGVGLPGLVWESKQPVWIPSFKEDAPSARSDIAVELGIGTGLAIPVLVDDRVIAIIECFMEEARAKDERLVRFVTAVASQVGSVIRRKQAEEALRKSEEHLHQVQKMEAIGQLTGGIAHDFNNLLAVILININFLLTDLGALDPRRDDAEEVRLAAERAAALTQQLLAFGRRQVLEPKVFSLNDVVSRTEKMISRIIGENIEVVTKLDDQLGSIHADVGRVEQVLMNLVLNARDAMEVGGQLMIETANTELDAEYALAHPPTKPGSYVMLSVRDTGCGMTTEIMRHVFEPFFTTKGVGRGTGLGLSTCYGSIKQSGGYIWVDSEPGKGSVFRVYLPRVDAPKQSIGRTVDPGPMSGTERILLVEDDERIRRATRRILEAKGYQVLEAKDGPGALDLSQRHEHAIDLVLSDVVMPGMSGPEVIGRIKEQRTSIRGLLMSGYTDHAMLREGVMQEGVWFIQKPFTSVTLAAKVREVLDG